MYAIETSNLTKVFNGYKAVNELSLKVPKGSIYGFLGPNGAGKTTTIKMLTGLSKPSSGEIKIFGKNVEFGSLKNRKDIGFLPDVPCFYDWMRPSEYLALVGELFSIDKKILNERIEYLLDLVGLEGVKKKIGGFSRGMKQRLGIAQALVNEPSVILLDEPTSALDPIGRKEVMDIILKLSGKVTVFFSTHILADVERVCDRVVILDKGKICIEEDMNELRKLYSSRGIIIEVGGRKETQEFTDALSLYKWAGEISSNADGEIILLVNDMKKAQMEIPKIISEKSLTLRKFNILESSLEDIFLKVVNK